VQAEGLSPKAADIRVLLVAHTAGTDAVAPLDFLKVDRRGQGKLTAKLNGARLEGLPVSGYTHLVVARDWPNPLLLLSGVLTGKTSMPRGLLKDAVTRFLSVPAKNTPPQSPMESLSPAAEPTRIYRRPLVPSEPPEKASPVEDVPIQPLQAVSPAKADASVPVFAAPAEEPSDDPLPAMTIPTPSDAPSIDVLPALRWPESVEGLQVYFAKLPPFAPFDAPGWRFVRVPMPPESGMPYCALGILPRDGTVVQVAYAVPGKRGAVPPPGLHGYRFQPGLNNQGYWVLWQNA